MVIDIETHEPVVQATAVDGIALVSDDNGDCKIYYCPISGLSVFEVPCSVLKNETAASSVDVMDQNIIEYPSEIKLQSLFDVREAISPSYIVNEYVDRPYF